MSIRQLLFPLALVLVLAGAATLWLAHAQPSGRIVAGQAALSYARRTTVWATGPKVRFVRATTLRDLRPVLRRGVPSSIAADINVGSLQHQYGAARRVYLVVLTGRFNSLPPDEGIVSYGAVVAIVDARTDRVLTLTD